MDKAPVKYGRFVTYGPNHATRELMGFIRYQFSAHGGQLYKRISLESSLNLITWPPSAIVLYPRETRKMPVTQLGDITVKCLLRHKGISL